jgi:redox-sensitive bicupin YhaK (pirin superfamily)
MREGGSIPIGIVFQQELGAPVVFMGFGLADDNLHAPNEKMHLPNFYRGIETVTYMLEGSVRHRDSLGNVGLIGAGDVQWMTAGRGIMHEEMPRRGPRGLINGFQLWVNLPATQKMGQPRYQEIKENEIPLVQKDGARVRVVALQATAGALGVELARSLGVNVWVRPNVAPARVTFAGEYTVEQLAWVLRGADVRLEVHDDGGVSLGEWSARDMLARQDMDERAADRASRAQERQMLEPVEMRLLRVPERVNAATVARIFCRHLASPSGWAAVAGRDLLVGERAGPLNQVERLVRELDRPETPPAPAPTAAPR